MSSTETDQPADDRSLSGAFEIHVSIEEPEIVMVEDAQDPESTEAIILKFDGELIANIFPEAWNVYGELRKIEVTSTYFAENARDENTSLKVLHPCTGYVVLDRDMAMIEFPIMHMRISPQFMRLLAAVSTTISSPAIEPSKREKKPGTVVRRHNVWAEHQNDECNFWFLNETARIDVGADRVSGENQSEASVMYRLKIKQIELILEADSGHGPVPMVHASSSLEALAHQWPNSLQAEAILTVEIWYRNEKFNVWEPVLEQVEKGGQRRPWSLEIFVTQPDGSKIPDGDVIPEPKMSCTITGKDHLQLTVTKTFLDVLTVVAEEFGRSTKQSEAEESSRSGQLTMDDRYEWAIRNVSGKPVDILPTAAFYRKSKCTTSLPEGPTIELGSKIKMGIEKHGETLPLYLCVHLLHGRTSERTVNVDISRSERRIFQLDDRSAWGSKWCFVVETRTNPNLNRIVTIRSPIKFVNHLPIKMTFYYKMQIPGSSDSWMCSCTAEGNGGECFPSLDSLYDYKGELTMTRDTVGWKKKGEPIISVPSIFQSKEWTLLVTLRPDDCIRSKEHYHVQLTAEVEETYFENTHRRDIGQPCRVVHLSAPTAFINALPYSLSISIKGTGTVTLKEGESKSLCTVVPGTELTLKFFRSRGARRWSRKMQVLDFSEITRHRFRSKVSQQVSTLDMGIRSARRHGTQELILYCPFWMINKTGRMLVYQNNVPTEFYHPDGLEKPLLFSFSDAMFFAKNKKARLKVDDSEWSDMFPVDIVGSAGKISCKDKSGKEREVSVKIQLSSNGLTKICTFTPFYLVDNRTVGDMEVRQFDAGQHATWTRVPSGQCVGFWPEKKSKRMQMCCRYVDAPGASQPFPFTECFESLVVMPNEFVGVYVTAQVSDNAVVVVLEEFQDGMAPVLLVNDTNQVEVFYGQKNTEDTFILPAGKCVLFAWANVLSKRQLVWSCGNTKGVEDDLMKDGIGAVNIKKNVKVYWVSFLSGRQRILLFTHDLATAATAARPYELERIDQQFTVSIYSIDVSLINNLIGTEIASIAITSSGIIWEYKKRRFRAYSIEDSNRLEEAYVKYRHEKLEGKKADSRVSIRSEFVVDFEMMQQRKPKRLKIRRSHQSALWLHYLQNKHQQQLHVKVNHFQIDNQLPFAVFHTFFAPVPPVKSVAAESIPRPFAEVSFIMRKVEDSHISQIKYFVVLVQEMSVQADKGFVNAMIEMFAKEQVVVDYGVEQYAKDLEATRQSLSELAAISFSTEQRAYCEHLHFSPMKINLSFSQGVSSGDDGAATPIHSELLNLLLKSVGVTLTEIHDAQFKLDYLERKGVFINRQRLISEATGHYTRQAIKQLHVLVLGLDIIGNPFGLMRDLSAGVETFFYEPIQGAIQGPEEFVEGLALGLKGLFGGAVGGAAGAVSRITGTLGKGLAALTLDDEYQRKRQQMLSRRVVSPQEIFARGAKAFVMGFADAVTGLVSKPIQGAKKSGMGGFVKGVGKGMIGFVTRPVGGVVDCASSSLEAVKRMVTSSEEVRKIRPARFIEPDKIIRQFSLHKAVGNHLLQESSKGRYAATDTYVDHAPLTADRKDILVVTDQRILMVTRTFGSLEVDWQYPWKVLAEAPRIVGNEMKVVLKEGKRNPFGSVCAQGKQVKFADKKIGEAIVARAKEAFERDL